MLKTIALATLAAGTVLAAESTALAQRPAGYPPSAGYDPRPVYDSPSVSPYLNLGETQGGLSNYHSLVRPMIEQRDAMARQGMNVSRFGNSSGATRDRKSGVGTFVSETKPRGEGAGRFMHLSHYFGGDKER